MELNVCPGLYCNVALCAVLRVRVVCVIVVWRLSMASDSDSMGELRPLSPRPWRAGSTAPSTAPRSASEPSTIAIPAPQSLTGARAVRDYERAAQAVKDLDTLLDRLTTSTPIPTSIEPSFIVPHASRTIHGDSTEKAQENLPSTQIWTTVCARRANKRGKHRARVRQSSHACEHESARRLRGLPQGTTPSNGIYFHFW